ncbi:unnamed protein product [Orchesella dallaii]|uniref:Uncharacterized protein n=1 Tax=Orchesella dallaii TaxID=48710 RepID=A0ABP1PY15_9HEXA
MRRRNEKTGGYFRVVILKEILEHHNYISTAPTPSNHICMRGEMVIKPCRFEIYEENNEQAKA